MELDISKDSSFSLPVQALLKHAVVLGSSGSGKTVLSKIIIEEAAIAGVSSILVDPQGDLASLILPAKEAAKPQRLEKLKEARVVIYTPMSSEGIPISINPLRIEAKGIEKEEIIPLIHEVAFSIAKLIGYDTGNDAGKSAAAVLYQVLKHAFEKGKPIESFDNLIKVIRDPPQPVAEDIGNFASEKDITGLVRKIKLLTVGQKELLFQFGAPMSIDMFLPPDRTQVNIIYLNTLPSQEEKEFFIAVLANQLYQWMLSNPKDRLQLLFYIDELAPYLPATSEKPMPKPILRLLYKQARKYGIGCIAATQNPADLDYRSLAQFSTWFIGRLTLKQDRDKVQAMLKSMSSEDFSTILPKLKAGQFVVFSPDILEKIERFTTRWLYTEHKTLNDEMVKAAIGPSLRDSFPYSQKNVTDQAPKDKETPLEKTKPAAKETGPKPKSKPHFPCNYSEFHVRKLLEKHRKKHFVMGPAKEEIAKVQLVWRPLLNVRIIQEKKSLFGRDNRIVDILADLAKGDFVIHRNNSFEFLKQFSYLHKLSVNQLRIFKAIVSFANPATAASIASFTGLTEKTVKNQLSKMHTVVASKGESWIERIMFRNSSLAGLHSSLDELETSPLEGKEEKRRFSEKSVHRIIEVMWEKASIESTQNLYLPVYIAEFQSNKGKRRVLINGVTAKIINP